MSILRRLFGRKIDSSENAVDSVQKPGSTPQHNPNPQVEQHPNWEESQEKHKGAQIPTGSPVNVTIDGTSFPLVNSVAALCIVIKAGGKGALRFPSLTYREVLLDLTRRLEKRYGRSSRQYQDSIPSPLVCAGCLWEFPGTYKLSLQGAFRGQTVVGGAPGFDQYGKSGICSRCGSDESLLVYEYFPPEQISMSDVDAIRRYWQQQARTWWQSRQKDGAFCDACDTVIARNQGYLENPSSLICEECVTKGLMTKGLEKLKGDPHYYGAALLRKVRHFST